MAEPRRHLQHIKSSVLNKAPLSSDLEYGEIAVNYANGSEDIFIKNANNTVVSVPKAVILKDGKLKSEYAPIVVVDGFEAYQNNRPSTYAYTTSLVTISSRFLDTCFIHSNENGVDKEYQPSETVLYFNKSNNKFYYYGQSSGQVVNKSFIAISFDLDPITITANSEDRYKVIYNRHNVLSVSTSDVIIDLTGITGFANKDFSIEISRDNAISGGATNLSITPSIVVFEEGQNPDIEDLTVKHYRYALITIKNGHLGTYQLFGNPGQNAILHLIDQSEVDLWCDTKDVLTQYDLSEYSSDIDYVVIKDNVTRIEGNTFADCGGTISHVDCLASTPPAITNSTFSVIDGNEYEIFVNLEDFQTYINASVWSSLYPTSGTKRLHAFKESKGQATFREDDSTLDEIVQILDYGEERETITSANINSVGDRGNLREIIINSNVKTIRAYCFANCEKLESVTIPDGVETLQAASFYNCKSITSLEIPESVTGFNSTDIFHGCTSLKTINIPSGISNIPINTFAGDKNLESIICRPTSPPTANNNAFTETNSTFIVYVPSESVTAYQQHPNWGGQLGVNRIQAIPTT